MGASRFVRCDYKVTTDTFSPPIFTAKRNRLLAYERSEIRRSFQSQTTLQIHHITACSCRTKESTKRYHYSENQRHRHWIVRRPRHDQASSEPDLPISGRGAQVQACHCIDQHGKVTSSILHVHTRAAVRSWTGRKQLHEQTTVHRTVRSIRRELFFGVTYDRAPTEMLSTTAIRGKMIRKRHCGRRIVPAPTSSAHRRGGGFPALLLSIEPSPSKVT